MRYMKVVFLKNHLHSKKGGVVELEYAAANYLIKMGVCQEVKEKKEMPAVKEKIEKLPLKEKKEK